MLIKLLTVVLRFLHIPHAVSSFSRHWSLPIGIPCCLRHRLYVNYHGIKKHK